MYTRKATVASAIGLHARPAAVFVRAVNRTGLPITLSAQGQDPVDGRSLLAVMSADFGHDSVVEISVAACDSDEETIRKAVDALAELLGTDLIDPS